MSRGIGKSQKEILKRIPDNGTIEINRLLWILAEDKCKIDSKKLNEQFSEGSINNSFYNK